ncbi:MAG: DNA/RNA non-specific endonuclease [Ferruginibacter sp.]
MRKNTRLGLYIIAGIFTLASCKKSDSTDQPIVVPPADSTSNPIQSPAKETFETGSKDDYASATIALTTGKWSFDNAVIGNTADDRKNGTKSARIQGAGKISMNFDVVGGVYRIAIASGTYGTDGPSTWQLWASYNSGSTYTQVGGDIVTSSAALQNDTIIVSTTGKARFSIRKVSGDANRLNIDDIETILTADPLPPNFADDNHLLLGNPDGATPSISNQNLEYYMDKGYYILSYNKNLSLPNWVSWHLAPSDIGTTPRQDDFRSDEALPATWYRVSDVSYSNSGFDRGHSCPSNDRTSTIAANSSTFLMTNMTPQAPFLNQGRWQKLEDSCNEMVTNKGKEVYIICGSYGVGGIGTNGLMTEIDNGRISVPQYNWKVVVVLPNGNNDFSRIDNNTRVISVIMPNDNSIGITTNWKGFRVSVHDIEQATGLNLLSNLPASVQQAIKDHVDNL